MQNALTFDLEEWYHPEAIRQSGLQVQRTSQVVEATTPLLDLLARYKTRATFFTVGEVAESHPPLIERILQDGHELAFHGWTHHPLWVLNPDSFRAEIEQFLAWLASHFSGTKILGYRAPTFSLDETTSWAVPVLAEHGFAYDSSIFPAKTPLYGVPNAPLGTYRITKDNLTGGTDKGLLEIPMSVYPLAGRKIGFTGGLYLRVLPWLLVKQMIKCTHQAGRAAIIYIHPWETSAQTPRVKLSPWGRFVLYHGLPSFDKLERLLQTFHFDSMQNIFLDKPSSLAGV